MKTFLALLKTFSLVELRTKEVSVVILSTVLLVSLMLAMGVGTAFLDPYSTTKVFPFIFWTTVITSISVGLGRSFEIEMKSGVMEEFVSSGINLRLVFFAKQFVVALILLLAMLLGLLLLGIVFQLRIRGLIGSFSILCFILSVAYSGLGNILSVVAMGSRLRAGLLPIILIPACFPLFFSSLELTYLILQKDTDFFSSPWFSLSIFLASLYTFLGAALFPAAVKAQI